LFFGNGTADIFSPKVVQASMGAIAKIAFNKGDLASFLSSSDTNTTIYGTFMEGDNVFQTKLKQNGILIMETKEMALSPTIERFIKQNALYIPPFPNQKAPIDSLNVATAAAIICAAFRRNNFLYKICKHSQKVIPLHYKCSSLPQLVSASRRYREGQRFDYLGSFYIKYFRGISSWLVCPDGIGRSEVRLLRSFLYKYFRGIAQLARASRWYRKVRGSTT
jgi:tRNA(Leu) C34 or U34 (ribose-2'-O)-methylase TrmL